MQVLPYQLEERLIEDVSTLHFAAGEYQAAGLLPAAVIAKQKVEHILQLLTQADIQPSGLFSSLFTLTVGEHHWYAMAENGNYIVRTADYDGFSCDQSGLLQFLAAALVRSPMPPESVYLDCVGDIMPLAEQPAIKINFASLTPAEWLKKAAENFLTYPKINLLQQTYQVKTKPAESKKIWTFAGALLLTCVALMWLGNLISFFILHYQANQVEKAIYAIYKKHFPDASALTAPRERMESLLKKVNNEENKNYFLVLLAATSQALIQAPSVHLDSLDFHDNQLNLTVSAAVFDDLDKFIQFFKDQGVTAKQENAAVSGTRVKANVLVQGGGA